MDLNGHINDLIKVGVELRKTPNVNKKMLNKAIARLEDAALYSEKIFDGRVLGIPTPDGSQVNPVPLKGATDIDQECTCPPGAIDNGCPVHGIAPA